MAVKLDVDKQAVLELDTDAEEQAVLELDVDKDMDEQTMLELDTDVDMLDMDVVWQLQDQTRQDQMREGPNDDVATPGG